MCEERRVIIPFTTLCSVLVAYGIRVGRQDVDVLYESVSNALGKRGYARGPIGRTHI